MSTYYVKPPSLFFRDRYVVYRKRSFWFDERVTSFDSRKAAEIAVESLEYIRALRIVGKGKRKMRRQK